ncbi:MAG: hypothetical protein QOI09_2432 [Chloroflexota bacterium]|jgi:hypothetical protein|nr:hypothetical protein [Chloroflexota bacterium]
MGADALETVAGVPITPSTAPVGRNWPPTPNATADTAMTTAATAARPIGTGRAERHRLVAGLLWRATLPAIAPASAMPQPGQAPPARAQHLSHACTPQDGHIDSRIPARVAAGPIRLPQRSQKGRGEPLEVADLGVLIREAQDHRNRRAKNGMTSPLRRPA